MKTFKTGTPVRLVQPTVQGVIVSGRLGEDGESVDYRVLYTLPNGEPFARFFSAEELEEVPDDADKATILEKHEGHLEVLAKNIELEDQHAKAHNAEHESAAKKAGVSVKQYLELQESARQKKEPA